MMKKLLAFLALIGGAFAFLRRRQSADQEASSFDWPPPPEPTGSMEGSGSTGTIAGAPGEATSGVYQTGAPTPAETMGGTVGEAPSAMSEASDLTTAPASEMDPELREQESRQTDNTRYDRLVEAEAEERRELAQEVADDAPGDAGSRSMRSDDDK